MQAVVASSPRPKALAAALRRLRSRSTVLWGLVAAVVWHLYRLQKRMPKKCVVIRGHWLFGDWPNLIEAAMKRTHLEFLQDLFRKTASKTYVAWHPFAMHVLVTMDRANVEYMLKTNFDNFPKGPVFQGRFQDLLGDGIFNTDGAQWHHQRKTTSHMFTAKLFKEHIWAVVRRNAKKVRCIVEEAAKPGAQVDVFNVMNRYTLDSIGEIGFGKSIGSLEDPSSPFLASFDLAQQQCFLRTLIPVWKLMRILNIGSERVMKMHVQRLDAYSRTVVRELRSALEAQERVVKERVSWADIEAGRSFVGLFIADAKKRGEQLTEDYLRDLVLNFLIAGRDTTAQSLAWTFYFLITHPEVEEKARKEIDGVCGGRELEYDDMKNLPYVTAVLNESMRLRPSVPIDGKESVAADTLPDGTEIPAGTVIYYVINGVNRDTDLWGADAAEFRPERWLEMSAMPDSYTYPVFNAGPRECLGKRLAMVEMQALIATVLPHISLELAVPKEKITYDAQITLGMAPGLPCLVKRLARHEDEATNAPTSRAASDIDVSTCSPTSTEHEDPSFLI